MENNKNPNIRFKGFTDPWEQRKFGDVGSVSMCKRIFKNETSDGGDIPFYKIGTFGGEPDAYISRELFEEYKKKFSYPNEGDILLSASGTIGRIVEYTGEDAYFQDSNIVWLSHDKSICNKFLKVLYPTVKWDGIEGSTIKRLYNDNFLKTQFMMPKIEEQERLGEYFEQLDHLITLHQRKYNKLLNVKKSMLEKMFPKNGSNIPEIRFKGFTDPWEQRKLKEILIQRTEHQKISDDAPLLAFSYAEGVISPEDKKSNKRDFIMTDKYNKIFSRTELNDIIYNPANVVHGAIHRNKLGTGVVSPIYKIFMCNGVSPKFIGERLHTDKFILEVTKFIEGTVVKLRTLSPEMFLEMSIEIPKSYEEQDRIGTYFTNLDNLITLHQRELEKLQNIKKSMLEKMFV